MFSSDVSSFTQIERENIFAEAKRDDSGDTLNLKQFIKASQSLPNSNHLLKTFIEADKNPKDSFVNEAEFKGIDELNSFGDDTLDSIFKAYAHAEGKC